MLLMAGEVVTFNFLKNDSGRSVEAKAWGEMLKPTEWSTRDVVSSMCWSWSNALLLFVYPSDWWVQDTVFVQSYMDQQAQNRKLLLPMAL